MYAFTNDELRRLSAEELSLLEEKSQSGDNMAQWQMAMAILYGQDNSRSIDDIAGLLTTAISQEDANALLLMGYLYEHALGVSKSYAKAIEYYVKAYDIINNIKPSGKSDKSDASKALAEMEGSYNTLISQISKIVAIKQLCQFKSDQFLFNWSDATRDSLVKQLPALCGDIAKFKNLYTSAITDPLDEKQGIWVFRYQNTLLMPLEVMKALVARDYFETHLKNNGFQTISQDVYFNNALGRCLIDDDDAFDNDYIISGLLNIAGHDESPLWQYRVGLWYEFNDNNLEPQRAVYWYEQAQKEIPDAKIAMQRLKGSVQYRIVENLADGTAEECKAILERSSKNPQNSIGWLIEGALRGDSSAMQRIESNQIASKDKHSVLGKSQLSEVQPYYQLLENEHSADLDVKKQWAAVMRKEVAVYRKKMEAEARKIAEEERKRLEAIRKAEEEAARKAKEEEEAKRKAEAAAKRKAKRLEEEAKRKAEEEAARKAKEEEEAIRKAEEEAARKAKEEEAAKRKAEAAAKRKAKRLEEEARRKAEEKEQERLRAVARAEAEKERELRRAKARKHAFIGAAVGIIPTIICIIFTWDSDSVWLNVGMAAFIFITTSLGTILVIHGDETEWKTILYRCLFAAIAIILSIILLIAGNGILSILISVLIGFIGVGCVGLFCKPSILNE